MLLRQMRHDKCEQTESGKARIARGRTKGSERHLWNERGVALAIDYVVNGQGGALSEFD